MTVGPVIVDVFVLVTVEAEHIEGVGNMNEVTVKNGTSPPITGADWVVVTVVVTVVVGAVTVEVVVGAVTVEVMVGAVTVEVMVS